MPNMFNPNPTCSTHPKIWVLGYGVHPFDCYHPQTPSPSGPSQLDPTPLPDEHHCSGPAFEGGRFLQFNCNQINTAKQDFLHRLASTQKWSGVCFDALAVSSLKKFWTPRALGLPIPSKWELMLVFPILVGAAGWWIVGVCMTYFTNTVLGASQDTLQWMQWLRERYI